MALVSRNRERLDAGVAALAADVNAFVAAVLSVSVFLACLLATGFVRRDEIRFVLRSVLPTGTP